MCGTACDAILGVERSHIILPENLSGPEGRAAIRAGAVGDFAYAFSGGSTNFDVSVVMTAGLLTDEWIHSGTAGGRHEIDRRDVAENNEQVLKLFESISRARRTTENAARVLAAADDADPRISELWALAGYTYLFLGETFCNGVPVSDARGGSIVHGTPRTAVELFETAIERFDRSLETNPALAHVGNLARLGKARALLNLDRAADAAGLVGSVPTDWAFRIWHSANTEREENSVHALNTALERFSLGDSEGANGLPFRKLADPRVPWARTPADDVGIDQTTPQYDLLKYPGPDAPVVLASGEEARYMEAEAALRISDPGSFFEHIDLVRARYGLGPATDPATDEEREDLLFRERALTMFATGKRLGDLRRLVRQYGRATADVFPVGTYFKDGTSDYGGAVNLPVPAQERTNPNFDGCLDRAA